jgi:hypothetical protein
MPDAIKQFSFIIIWMKPLNCLSSSKQMHTAFDVVVTTVNIGN